MQLLVVALDKNKSTLEESGYSRQQAYAGSLEYSYKFHKRTILLQLLKVKVPWKRGSVSIYAGSLFVIVHSHDRM